MTEGNSTIQNKTDRQLNDRREELGFFRPGLVENEIPISDRYL